MSACVNVCVGKREILLAPVLVFPSNIFRQICCTSGHQYCHLTFLPAEAKILKQGQNMNHQEYSDVEGLER